MDGLSFLSEKMLNYVVNNAWFLKIRNRKIIQLTNAVRIPLINWGIMLYLMESSIS